MRPGSLRGHRMSVPKPLRFISTRGDEEAGLGSTAIPSSTPAADDANSITRFDARPGYHRAVFVCGSPRLVMCFLPCIPRCPEIPYPRKCRYNRYLDKGGPMISRHGGSWGSRWSGVQIPPARPSQAIPSMKSPEAPTPYTRPYDIEGSMDDYLFNVARMEQAWWNQPRTNKSWVEKSVRAFGRHFRSAILVD
jgi:hypothetical protein